MGKRVGCSARLSIFSGGSMKALGLGRNFHHDEDDSDQYDHGDIINNTTVYGFIAASAEPG